MDALNEIEVLVNRTIRTIVRIASKVTRFATILLAIAVAVCVGSFLLGLAALSGGIRTVWIVLGIVFASVAIGAAFVGRWGVGRIRKDVPAIAGEVRRMITEGREQGGLIIEQFDQQMNVGQMNDDEDGALSDSAIVVSRRVYGLRDFAGHGLQGAAKFTAAVRSITRFPLLALLTIAITLVFGFLALIFLLALAL